MKAKNNVKIKKVGSCILHNEWLKEEIIIARWNKIITNIFCAIIIATVIYMQLKDVISTAVNICNHGSRIKFNQSTSWEKEIFLKRRIPPASTSHTQVGQRWGDSSSDNAGGNFIQVSQWCFVQTPNHKHVSSWLDLC